MGTHPKLASGEVVIRGIAQAMQDGTWSAKCLVITHFGPHSDECMLPSFGAFETESEAVSAGLHQGMDWVNTNYPLPT